MLQGSERLFDFLEIDALDYLAEYLAFHTSFNRAGSNAIQRKTKSKQQCF